MANGDEDSLVEQVVDFANGVDPSAGETDDHKFVEGLRQYLSVGDLEQLREEVRTFLGIVALRKKLPARTKRQFEELFSKRLRKVRTFPQISLREEEVILDVIAMPSNLRETCWLAVAMCADPTWDYGRRLLMCSAMGCENLILKRRARGGRPNERCPTCSRERRLEKKRKWMQDSRRL